MPTETPAAEAGTRMPMECDGDLLFTQLPLLFLTGVALSEAVPASRASRSSQRQSKTARQARVRCMSVRFAQSLRLIRTCSPDESGARGSSAVCERPIRV